MGVNENKDKKERFEVLLEAIQSDFKAFGESLDLVHKKMDGLAGRVDEIDKKIVRMDVKLDAKADQSEVEAVKAKIASLNS